MRHIFMDESGTISFGENGTEYFVLAFVSPQSGKSLNKCIKNFNAHLLRNGWNPDVEIKASNVWMAGSNNRIPPEYKYKATPEVPLEHIFAQLAGLDLYIEDVTVKLDTVKEGLRTVNNSILYNYFSLQLLKGPFCYFPSVSLFADRRNKERHRLLKFDGYIEGAVAIARGEKNKPRLALSIEHLHWKSADEYKAEERARIEFGVRGIEAADFVCWADLPSAGPVPHLLAGQSWRRLVCIRPAA